VLVTYGVLFVVMAGMQHVSPGYSDVIFVLIGLALVVASIFLRMKLNAKMGWGWLLGLDLGLLSAGFELCEKSLWWQSNVRKALLFVSVGFVIIVFGLALYKKYFKKS